MPLSTLRRLMLSLHIGKKNKNNFPITSTCAEASNLATDSKSTRAEPILTSAIYRFYLIKKYSIKKIDGSGGKIRCDEELFDSDESAFEYANKL